jgi:hypothetical protein
MLKQYQFITSTRELDQEIAFEWFKQSNLYEADSNYFIYFVSDDLGWWNEICKII